MKGAKRFAGSDSSLVMDDSIFRNKRVMVGSAFDIHRAESSQNPSTVTAPLNMQRAESSRQHVRALNAQFASWVQAQLKNHPDELWEDGVKDYLAHASNVMEKFKDVVDWLKSNAAKGESLNDTEKKSLSEVKSNEIKLFQGQTGPSPVSTTTSFLPSWNAGSFSNSQNSKDVIGESQSSCFLPSWNAGLFSNSRNSKDVIGESQSSAVSSKSLSSGFFFNSQSSAIFSGGQSFGSFSTSQNTGVSSSNQSSGMFSNTPNSGFFSNSQSSGLFSNNQSPVFFGNNKSSVTANTNASNDVDGDNEEQPSSPSLKKSEETGITVVHEVKCKLYVKSSDSADKDPWKDKGTGQLSIKCKEGAGKGTKDSKPTIIVRNEVGRIQLNAMIYPGIKTNLQKNAIVAIFHTAGDGDDNNVVARTFLIRLKTEDDRNKLAKAIQDCAPSS